MIALWIVSYWESLDKPKIFNIVELGPGNGKMCKTMMNTFKNFPEFYKSKKVFLYEKSEFLKKIQKKNLRDYDVKWLSSIKLVNQGPVIFYGNEFFDAIPVKQYQKKNKETFERFVKIETDFKTKVFLKKISKKNDEEIRKFKVLKNNNFIEFPKLGFKELEKMISKINKLNGGLLLIDYGYTKKINRSTLQSIKLHKKNKLYENIGNSDVTSLVNFNLLKEFFSKKKLYVNKVVSQSFFLKRMGILQRAEIISKKMSFKDKSNLYFRLNRLLSAEHMGELFRVIFASNQKKGKNLGFF